MVAASLGCGLISQAKNLVQSAKILGDFADRLGKSEQLTYTAEYQVTSGDKEKVTLVQQPPNVAYLGKDGSRVILTQEFLFLCSPENGQMSCQKSANQTGTTSSAADAGAISTVAGQGFVTPEIAIALVAAAALVPGAKVAESTKTIAGEKSLCADVTGLESAASPSDSEALQNFSVCVTESGVLASFNGALTSGEKGGVELIKFSDDVDPSAFEPPAGAEIVDLTVTAPEATS